MNAFDPRIVCFEERFRKLPFEKPYSILYLLVYIFCLLE